MYSPFGYRFGGVSNIDLTGNAGLHTHFHSGAIRRKINVRNTTKAITERQIRMQYGILETPYRKR